MVIAAIVPLIDNSHIQELLEVIKSNKMETQFNDVSMLVEYIDTMEKQLTSVLDELNNVQYQLNELKDTQHPIKTSCQKMLNDLQTQVKTMLEKFNEVKTAIIEGAKNALSAFKEKGIIALDGVMNFFNVKKGLNSISRDAEKAIALCENSIAKINTISKEVHAVGSHMRNIGRAMMGKDIQDDVKANGIISKTAQLPFHLSQKVNSNIKKTVNALAFKLDLLNSNARENVAKATEKKENKASILQAVKGFKQPISKIKEPVQENRHKETER